MSSSYNSSSDDPLLSPQQKSYDDGYDPEMSKHVDGRRRSSVRFNVSDMEKLDQTEPVRRPSVLRRESFIAHFARTRGPPQIAFLMVIVNIGLGSTIGVVPAVMSDRFARLNFGYDRQEDCSSFSNNYDKPEECFLGSADAQNAAATANLISNVLTFITSSLVGSLSDEYGRRGILILGLSLSSFSPLMLLLIQLCPAMSPWWYYGFHASTGIINWVAVALSALADVLPKRFRAPGIGMLLAGFMLGFSLSPIFALVLSRIHLSLISYLIVVGGLIATYFVLPETLPPEVADEARKRNMEANKPSVNVDQQPATNTLLRYWPRKILRFISRPVREMSILNRSSFFRLISVLAFFSGMVTSGDQLLLVYYVEERLGFTEKDVSYIFLIMGVMGLMAQVILLKPLNDCVGEKMVIAICFTIGAIDNTMYGLATQKSTIYAAVALAAFTMMSFPTLSAIKANNVNASEQGRIQGALYSVQALASGVGPIVLRVVYSQAKETIVGPGVMFIFAGALYLVAVAVACMLPKEKTNSRQDNDLEELDDFSFDGKRRFHNETDGFSSRKMNSYGSIQS